MISSTKWDNELWSSIARTYSTAWKVAPAFRRAMENSMDLQLPLLTTPRRNSNTGTSRRKNTRTIADAVGAVSDGAKTSTPNLWLFCLTICSSTSLIAPRPSKRKCNGWSIKKTPKCHRATQRSWTVFAAKFKKSWPFKLKTLKSWWIRTSFKSTPQWHALSLIVEPAFTLWLRCAITSKGKIKLEL